MPSTTYTLSFVLSLLSSALATPQPLKLDFTKSYGSPLELVKRDGTVEITLNHNAQRILYETTVNIGTPAQQFTLQVDTGSSDTWVPAASSAQCQQGGCANGAYTPSDSSTFSQLTTQDGSFNISYDSPGDTDSGYYFNDVLALTSSVTIKNMTIGLATYAFDNQGLLGMGFAAGEASVQTLGTTTPTVTEQLVIDGVIARSAFSLYMNDLDAQSGSILFGGIDTSKYTGDLVAFPVQLDVQDDTLDEWAITLTSVSVTDDSGTRLLSSPDLAVGALLDTGTSGLVLPDDIFTAILNGMGASFLGDDYQPLIDCSAAKSNASFTFGFGGQNGLSVTVPVSQMIAQFYVDSGATYGDGDPQCNLDIGSQVDDLTGSVILGDAFLRAAYVVYDAENKQIALAQANLNPGSENIVAIPSGTSLPGVSSTVTVTAVTSVAPATNGYSTVSADINAPATPTFNLGVAMGTGASGSSNGAASVQVGSLGVGVSVGLGLMSLLAALVL